MFVCIIVQFCRLSGFNTNIKSKTFDPATRTARIEFSNYLQAQKGKARLKREGVFCELTAKLNKTHTRPKEK